MASSTEVTNFKAIGFGRPLSELNKSRNFLDPNSYIEISRIQSSGGTTNASSYKTTLGAMDFALIDNFKLYTNLDKIFNPMEHLNETYFEEKTTFKDNPFVHEENNVPKGNETLLFHSLDDQNLITKRAVEEYLDNIGICVPVNAPGSDYVYYSYDEQRWVTNNKKVPMVMDYQKDGIWTSESKLKFQYGTSSYYFTDEIEAPKNIMLNVTGNIILNYDYKPEWYELTRYFVGLTINGKLITMVFLKNILKLENPLKRGTYYNIAQFHFYCPLAAGAKFRIITNADCRLFGISEDDIYSRKLYDSLNAVNLSYYDYGHVASENYNIEPPTGPSLWVTPENIELRPVCPRHEESASAQFIVHGTNISDPIDIEILNDYGHYFNLDKYYIDPVETIEETCTLTFNPPRLASLDTETTCIIKVSIRHSTINTYLYVTGKTRCEPEGLRVSPNTLRFTLCPNDESRSNIFNVYGQYLDGDVNLSLSDTEHFSISPSSFTPSGSDKVVNGNVTVSFLNNELETDEQYTGEINCESLNATSRNVSLVGELRDCCGAEIKITDEDEVEIDSLTFPPICQDEIATITATLNGSCLYGDNVSVTLFFEDNNDIFSVEPSVFIPIDHNIQDSEVSLIFNPPISSLQGDNWNSSLLISSNITEEIKRIPVYASIATTGCECHGSNDECWRLTDISGSRGRTIRGGESYCLWYKTVDPIKIPTIPTDYEQFDIRDKNVIDNKFAKNVTINIYDDSPWAPITKPPAYEPCIKDEEGPETETQWKQRCGERCRLLSEDDTNISHCICRCKPNNDYGNPYYWTVDSVSTINKKFTWTDEISAHCVWKYNRDTCEQSSIDRDVIIQFFFEKNIATKKNSKRPRSLQNSNWKLIGFSHSTVVEADIVFYSPIPNIENSTYSKNTPEYQASIIATKFAPHDFTNNVECDTKLLSVEWCRNDDIPANSQNAHSCNITYGIISMNNLMQTCVFTFQKEIKEEE